MTSRKNCTTFSQPTSVLLLVSLLTATLLSGCSHPETRVVESSEEPPLPVTTVIKRTLNRLDQLPAEIEAYQDVAVYPKVPGFITWIGVDRGSTVKKGQLMCKLVAPELGAQRNEANAKSKSVLGLLSEAKSKYAAAKASLMEAKAQLAGDNDTYTRTKDASATPGVVAPNDVVVLQNKVEADKEKIAAWQENVDAAKNAVDSETEALQASQQATSNYRDIEDYLTIRAPFDGYVTERNMHVGSFVGPLGKGAYPPIIRVQELDLLRVVTPVPEINVGAVVPGAQVQFTVSTHPGERFVGTVARIGNSLEQKTRTMPVELNYLNPGWKILPGMFCEVYWPTRRAKPSLFVPPSSVATRSTLNTFVIRINKNDETEWVPIDRGEMMDGMIEVFGDLHEGDRIALRCSDSLKPQTKVKPELQKFVPDESTKVQRPVFHVEGVPVSMPNQEIKEMEQPENKGKQRIY